MFRPRLRAPGSAAHDPGPVDVVDPAVDSGTGTGAPPAPGAPLRSPARAGSPGNRRRFRATWAALGSVALVATLGLAAATPSAATSSAAPAAFTTHDDTAGDQDTYHRRISLDMSGCGIVSAGERGRCVESLQTWLNLEGGYDLDVDGVFGRLTRRAVQDFQSRHDLPTVGTFGPRSRRALRAWWQETMSDGDSVPGHRSSVEGVYIGEGSDADVHTSMGDDVVRSIACQGVGAIAGWVTRSRFLGVLAGVVCDVVLSRVGED